MVIKSNLNHFDVPYPLIFPYEKQYSPVFYFLADKSSTCDLSAAAIIEAYVYLDLDLVKKNKPSEKSGKGVSFRWI